MSMLLFSLLACFDTNPGAVPITTDPPQAEKTLVDTLFPAPPSRVEIPTGKAIVRQCTVRGDYGTRGPSARKNAQSAAPAAAAAPAPVTSTSAASAPSGDTRPKARSSPFEDAQGVKAMTAAPPASEATGGLGVTGAGLGGGGSVEGLGGAPLGAKGEAEKIPMARSSPRKSPAPVSNAVQGRERHVEKIPSLDQNKPDPKVAEPMADPPRPTEVIQPSMEWGATVYLSNDDSMSLASAQRLLYAVQNDVRFSSSQIRPHELLNYFSFDTAPVHPGEMFSVMASAEQTSRDTLSLALAVKGATPPRLPLDLTLLVDRSGSMSAEGRMDYVKRALELLDQNLVLGDRVDLVLFDSEVCTPLEDFVVGRDERGLLAAAISAIQPRSNTNLDIGLKEAYRLARDHMTWGQARQRNHRVMVLTDALLNTGNVDTNVVSDVGKAYEEHGIRLTGVGVGREFNDTMLDRLTEKGKGGYVFLGSGAVVERLFGPGFESLTRTIAHDVRFALDLPPSLAMERFYGEESSTNPEDVQPINYYSGTTQVFLQDLKARDVQDADALRLVITYEDATTGRSEEQALDTTLGALLRSDPRNLRKARALMAWTDVLSARALGDNPCGEVYRTFTSRLSGLEDDAELNFVKGLVAKKCEDEVALREVASAVRFKVRLDSDIPIAEVGLACQGERKHERLPAGTQVAVFEATPGPCQLTLAGVTDMTAAVVVPKTGGDLRCLVRGGRLSCS